MSRFFEEHADRRVIPGGASIKHRPKWINPTGKSTSEMNGQEQEKFISENLRIQLRFVEPRK